MKAWHSSSFHTSSQPLSFSSSSPNHPSPSAPSSKSDWSPCLSSLFIAYSSLPCPSSSYSIGVTIAKDQEIIGFSCAWRSKAGTSFSWFWWIAGWWCGYEVWRFLWGEAWWSWDWKDRIFGFGGIRFVFWSLTRLASGPFSPWFLWPSP